MHFLQFGLGWSMSDECFTWLAFQRLRHHRMLFVCFRLLRLRLTGRLLRLHR